MSCCCTLPMNCLCLYSPSNLKVNLIILLLTNQFREIRQRDVISIIDRSALANCQFLSNSAASTGSTATILFSYMSFQGFQEFRCNILKGS